MKHHQLAEKTFSTNIWSSPPPWTCLLAWRLYLHPEAKWSYRSKETFTVSLSFVQLCQLKYNKPIKVISAPSDRRRDLQHPFIVFFSLISWVITVVSQWTRRSRPSPGWSEGGAVAAEQRLKSAWRRGGLSPAVIMGNVWFTSDLLLRKNIYI